MSWPPVPDGWFRFAIWIRRGMRAVDGAVFARSATISIKSKAIPARARALRQSTAVG